MASFSNSAWFCSLKSINHLSSPKPNSFPLTNPQFRPHKISFSLTDSTPDSDSSEQETAETDPIKLAFSKAKAYKKSIQSEPNLKNGKNRVPENVQNVSKDVGPGSVSKQEEEKEQVLGRGKAKEVPIAPKIAMEKAKEYKKNKELPLPSGNTKASVEEKISGLKGEKERNSSSGVVEKPNSEKKELTLSSIDFVGLDFADKKTTRGLPAGLVPIDDPFPEGDLPEVEIIIGDSSKFGAETPSKPEPPPDGNSELYKPKVSTWGVFPRPSNISKTFGGGRNIAPGETLETAEEKAAKQARTRQLLAAYKSKIGLNVDAKTKAECEKALKDGDSLMDLGKLKDALPCYQKVMDKVAFQTELHGLAALQWSICQDSLSRPKEAQVMYEKLLSHPNVQVSKIARQFIFGFEAMEMMKVKTNSPINIGYQNFFEAFVEDKPNYPLQEVDTEEGNVEVLPYVIFLVFPIFVVLLVAVQKGTFLASKM
ncbi:hypothetical protein RJ641_036763 [Dillenia turbinata]|uniref:Uncharacterized protein n=1 Tax=Dillenia turbinata TaxID=194707 RepID=A0AAN8ZB89_9MAGN